MSENYDEEDEHEYGKILPVTMVTTSSADAVHYAVAMTTSPHSRHTDPELVEIDLLDQGYRLLTSSN